jgi:hypothetical protein
VHEATSVVDVAIATLTFDDLLTPPRRTATPATPTRNSESTI